MTAEQFGVSREAFDAWLSQSCRSADVPLRVSDPAALAKLAAALGASRVSAGADPRGARGAPRAPVVSEPPVGDQSAEIVA